MVACLFYHASALMKEDEEKDDDDKQNQYISINTYGDFFTPLGNKIAMRAFELKSAAEPRPSLGWSWWCSYGSLLERLSSSSIVWEKPLKEKWWRALSSVIHLWGLVIFAAFFTHASGVRNDRNRWCADCADDSHAKDRGRT